MQLYIPTCSLNLNNILSTDSISPAATYESRGFGNKRFFSVKPCPNDRYVFLYSSIPSFHVDETDMENSPVVIGIESRYLPISVRRIATIGEVDVYACEETIHFSPKWTSFFCDDSLRSSLAVKARMSNENKTFDLYNFGNLGGSFRCDRDFISHIPPVTIGPVKGNDDRRYDKLMGAIICYYAGLVPPVLLDSYRVKKNIAILKGYCESSMMRIKKEMREDLSLFFNIVDEQEHLYNNIDRYLKQEMERVEKIENIFKLSQSHPIIEIKDDRYRKDFYLALMDKLINDQKSKTNAPSVSLAYALLGAEILRDALGEKWEGSPTREYVNSLLNNIQCADPFDICSVDSEPLRAWAEFSLRGEGEIDKLNEFLDKKGIMPSPLVWGLWGAAHGYSALPKTFTCVFLSENLLSSVFKLLNQDRCFMGGVIPDADNFVNVPLATDVLPRVEEAVGVIEKEEIEENVGAEDSDSLLSRIVKIVENAEWPKRNPERAMKHYISKINEIFRQETRPKYADIEKIEDCNGGKIYWKKVLKKIKREMEFDEQTLFSARISDLNCFQGLNDTQLNRVDENWDWVTRQGRTNKEKIKYFINLCKKESRGGLKSMILKDVFTEDLAEACQEELKERYGV